MAHVISAGTPSATSTEDLRAVAVDHARRVDRISTLGHVIAHLAHQLVTPLNVIDGRAAMIAAEPTGDEAAIRRNARIIAEQSARMTQILRDAVAFCHHRSSHTTLVDFLEITRSAASMLGPMAMARRAAISVESSAASVDIEGNPDDLFVLIARVLENGVRVTPEGGSVKVLLRTEVRREAASELDGSSTFLCVDIDDEGPGISEQMLPRLFVPFATTFDAHTHDASGDAIGLFIAQAIATEHRGWIEGMNRGAGGARFIVHLLQGQTSAK